MTSTTTNIVHDSGFRRFLRAISRGMQDYAHTASRRAKIERLEAKSDDELAKLGIRRDEIAIYVFRDLFYA